MTPLFAFPLGMPEMIGLGLLAILLFGGRRLPELGRSLGRGIVEFKKGIKGLEDEDENKGGAGPEPKAELPRPPQRITPAAPRFEETPADKPNTQP